MLQVALSDDSRVFEIKGNQFVKNGKPIQIISGRCATLSPALHMATSVKGLYASAFSPESDPDRDLSLCSIHYFRVHPFYWEDRLLKMKAMGLNAIEVRSNLLSAETLSGEQSLQKQS